MRAIALSLVLLAAPPLLYAFELRDGDRVAFIGGATVERAIYHNYLETILTLAYPGRELVFRNLGWSGDTVEGRSRTVFKGPEAGFATLLDHLAAIEPTLVFVAYGANESFAGAPGLDTFRAGLTRLVDAITAAAARVVLVTPFRAESLGAPLPDAGLRNTDLELYVEALRAFAGERELPLVDIFGHDFTATGAAAPRLTYNGIHLSDAGYWHVARAMAAALGLRAPAWKLVLERGERPVREVRGLHLGEVEPSARGLRFRVTDQSLPWPGAPPGAPPEERSLAVRGLEPGSYVLRIDGETVATATAAEWAAGVVLGAGPEVERTASLRTAIARKNELFFHRFRPQNETYLFLFRKGEQGHNAREVPLFDPLIAAAQARIRSLAQPVARTYELERIAENP